MQQWTLGGLTKNPTLLLTPQVIEQIRLESKEEWRKCQMKNHDVYACLIPDGYVFVDEYLQSESYDTLIYAHMNGFRDKRIIPRVEFEKQGKQSVAQTLIRSGCYLTDPTKYIVVCGEWGDLYNVPLNEFFQRYRLATGERISPNNLPQGWFKAVCLGDNKPMHLGFPISRNYQGYIPNIYGIGNLHLPDTSSKNIIVVPVLPNGQPNFNNISIYENGIFAKTFNYNVGSWLRDHIVSNVDNRGIKNIAKVKSFGYDPIIGCTSNLEKFVAVCARYRTFADRCHISDDKTTVWWNWEDRSNGDYDMPESDWGVTYNPQDDTFSCRLFNERKRIVEEMTLKFDETELEKAINSGLYRNKNY
jgi:hypothetical protein